ELRGEVVAAVGRDPPAPARVVPREPLHLGVEERVVVQTVLPADAPRMLEDLGPVRVLLARHVPGLFEQRHVYERGRVALRSWIAIPVPGAAEVPALLDHAPVANTGLAEARSGHQTREAAADERESHVVASR